MSVPNDGNRKVSREEVRDVLHRVRNGEKNFNDREKAILKKVVEERQRKKSEMTDSENKTNEINRNSKRKSVKGSSTIPVENIVEDEDSKYAVDPKSGEKYRKLPSAPKEVIKSNKKGMATMSQLRQFVEVEDDFDGDNLNKAAQLFIPKGLRTAPSKEELQRLRKEREIRMKKQQKEFEDYRDDLMNRFGDNDDGDSRL